MELTVDFETGIIEHLANDRAFVSALLNEVDMAIAAQEKVAAQGMLRVLVTGTVGYDVLSQSLPLSNQSLQESLAKEASPDITFLTNTASALKLALAVTAG